MTKSNEFHYTNETMVRDLLELTPIGRFDSVLDAGSGLNKVWYNNIANADKYECEYDDGCDFFNWTHPVDWIVGNPPFSDGWKFTEHALTIANVGIAWLLNNQALNSNMTPRRLQITKDAGFTYKHIHVVADARWFGRYYYLLLTKGGEGILSWERKTYKIEATKSQRGLFND